MTELIDVAGRQRAGDLPRKLCVEAGVDGLDLHVGGSNFGVFVGLVHK